MELSAVLGDDASIGSLPVAFPTTSLFPPTRRAHVLATAVATVVIAAFRRPDALLNPQFFVEDGTIFFADDHHLGIHALYKPYAGYIHLAPRLVALLASQWPLEIRPALYAWCSLGILVLLSLLATNSRVELPLRPCFALAPLLVPIGGFVYMHLTNIQWFLGIGQLWMLLRRPPERRLDGALDGALLILMGLTGPFCIVTLALWPLRLWRHRPSPYEWSCLAALAGCALIQLHCLTSHSTGLSEGGFEHASIAWLSRQAANLCLGQQWPRHLQTLNSIPATVLLFTLLALVTGTPKALRPQVTLIALFGTALLLLGIYRIHPEARGANAFLSGSRYFLIPHTCAAFCGLLALGGRPWIRAVAWGFLGVLLLSAATKFDRPWPQDMHWKRYCERIRRGEPVVVPINWPGWRIILNSRSR